MKEYLLKNGTDLGLFLVRFGLGLVFAIHGWAKFSALGGTVGFFGSLGLPAAAAYLVSAIELVGGVALILGLFARWAALGVAAVMVGAMVLLKLKAGFLGGYEFDLMLFLAALGIALAGSGKYALKK